MFEKCECGHCDPARKMTPPEGFAAETGAKLKAEILNGTTRDILNHVDALNGAIGDGDTFAHCHFSVFAIAFEDPEVVKHLAAKLDDPEDQATIRDGLRLLKVLEKHREAMILEFNTTVDAIHNERANATRDAEQKVD